MNDPTLLRYAPHMSHDHVKDIQLARRLRGNGRDYWFFLGKSDSSVVWSMLIDAVLRTGVE